jgi:sulfite exporter TauE/SafE
MIEWPLVIAGGVLGSAHCAGMCGGFAVALGSGAASLRANAMRQVVFGGGRMFSYVFIGATAGYAGGRLTAASGLVDAQSWLAVAAGLLLVWQGLAAAGVLGLLKSRFRSTKSRPVGGGSLALPACVQPGLLGGLLRRRGSAAALAAGVLTGLLPCGLVYAFATLAASTGSLGAGAAVMACFGAGTVPLMTALGLGASLVGAAGRRRMFACAAWCVVLSGAVSVSRGATNLAARYADPESAPKCPMCEAGRPAGGGAAAPRP